VKRLACALVLVMVLGTGCRGGESAPAGPGGADQEMSDVESTLDAIESELAGD
jgi:hypothetical protein